MPPVVLLLVLVAVPLRGSGAAWCVCRPNATEEALQKTLDYACGHDADCAPVLTGGSCHSPDSVAAHCSYAANSYYQRNSQTQGATGCDFGGTATLSSTDPSSGTCKYPATPSAAGTGNGTSSSSPTTPGMGGSFTTPIGAYGPAANTLSPENDAPPRAAAAFVGLRGLLGVASILAFLVQ